MATFMDFLVGNVQSSPASDEASPILDQATEARQAPGPARFDPLFDQASKETGIPAAILKAQAMQESTFDPNVVSTTGGIGLLQVQPSTARDPGYGVEPIDPAKLKDPAENVRFASRYLAARAKAEGVENWNDPQQVAKALAAYNGGGDPNYVQNVFKYLKPPGEAQSATPTGAQAPATGPFDINGNPLPPRYARAEAQAAPDGQPAQPVTPRPFFKPAPGIPVRPGVDMDNIGEGARGVFGALAKLNIPGLEVVSGYRDPARNARVGGAKGSQHIHGNAIDINIDKLSDEDRARVIDTAYKAGARGIGIYPGGRSLHFDVRETPAAWGANPAAPYRGVSDPNAFPEWARPTLAQLLKGQSLPSQATAYAAASSPAAAAPSAQPRNPTVQAAAERGRGSLADRFAMGGNVAEGPSAMPFQPMPDMSNSPDGGARDFMLREAGGAAAQDGGPLAGIFGMLAGNRQAGSASAPPGMVIPGGSQAAPSRAATVESLIPFTRPNPFGFFGEAARENEQAEAQHRGLVFAAKQLVAQGMSPQDAVAAVYSPSVGQQLALSGVKQQREAAVNADMQRRLAAARGAPDAATQSDAATTPPQTQASPSTAAPSPSGASPAAARPGDASARPVQMPPAQPAPASNSPRVPLGTGNRTVETLFAQRDAKLAEYRRTSDEMIKATTDAAKAAVQAQLQSIKEEVGGIDKKIEQYSPTGPMKEYTAAMVARQDRGEKPIPYDQWDPEAEKKAARGPQTEEVTNLRKEVQGLPSYKNMSQAAPIYKSMLDAVTRDDRASDVNLIYGLAKVMDPTSVVRESEMTVAQAIATLPQQVQQSVRSQLGSVGRLSKDVREGIMREAFSRVNAYGQLFNQDTELYRGIAERRKIDVADVLPNFGEFKPYEPPEKPKANGGSTPAVPGGAATLPEVPPQYVRPDGSSPPMPRAEASPTPPKVATKSEWEKLAPGSLYTDAKGDVRRKGGN